MMYDKKSISYQINQEALHEMEECVPMTLEERKCIRHWVNKGHELESNPWEYTDSDGMPLNFLQAYRLEIGYSSGPWDYWKGPEHQPYWNDDLKCFFSKDELC
ncbi:MAG TPA: hypothetical protein VN258_13995 [Mobilitalea sp.]|nr:hypothetical protein [Mobilitalea sp.]